MKRFRYGLLTGLTLLTLWLAHAFGPLGTTPSWAFTHPEREIRGVWITNVDSDVLFSKATVEGALQRLADHHFNTVYPAVWSWGYTLFPSQVATRVIGHQQGIYPDLEAQGRNEALEASQGNRDLLLEVVNAAHSRNLSVIPWFEFGFMAPANSELALRHPDWITQKRGNSIAAQRYQEGRHTRVWLNPFHPEVQQFLLDLVAELMANYEVDGLQLDDHFGLPVEFGYDPYTTNLYRQEHGGKAPPANPYDAEWMRWRADKITQFLDRLFRTVKVHRPEAVLSVSPNPPRFAYSHFLQDWNRWWQDGYIEELVVQVYRDNLSNFRATLQDPVLRRARSHIPTGIGILTGLKDAPVSMSLIRQQVQTARAMNYSGISFFFYDTLWRATGEADTERAAAVRSLFPSATARP